MSQLVGRPSLAARLSNGEDPLVLSSRASDRLRLVLPLAAWLRSVGGGGGDFSKQRDQRRAWHRLPRSKRTSVSAPAVGHLSAGRGAWRRVRIRLPSARRPSNPPSRPQRRGSRERKGRSLPPLGGGEGTRISDMSSPVNHYKTRNYYKIKDKQICWA